MLIIININDIPLVKTKLKVTNKQLSILLIMKYKTENTQRYWGINVYGEALSDMGHHG